MLQLLSKMDFAGIKQPILKAVVEISTGMAVRIIGREKGFQLLLQFNSGEKTLINSRGEVRLFASLDSVASYLAALGLLQFEVDMSHYRPGRLRGPRPDRAEALKRTRTKLRQQSLLASTAE